MNNFVYRRYTYSNYLQDLINPDSPEPVKLMASNFLKKIVHGNFCLMVTLIDDVSSSTAYAPVAINHITQAFKNVICTTFDNCIITLIGGMSSRNLTKKETIMIENITKILNQVYSVNGISNCFSCLEEIPIYYPQAYYTTQLKRKGTTYYKDVTGPASMVMTLQNVPYETFVHPALEELLAYDEEHNTQYFDTLRIYSLYLHDKEKASSELGIHRNTLLYRLNKIQEIFDLPFEEPETALYLVNSFEFYQVKKMMDAQNRVGGSD